MVQIKLHVVLMSPRSHCLQSELNTDLTKDNLRCQVLWSPTKRPGSTLHPFGKAKICYLEMRTDNAAESALSNQS